MPRIYLALRCSFVMLVAIISLGCDRSAVCRIHGSVTYKGRPIPSGEIRLLPADGKGPTAGGKITDGRYEIRVLPGEKAVEIYQYESVGPTKQRDPAMRGPSYTEIKQTLPAIYNNETTLRLEVTTSAEHNVDLPQRQ